MATLYATETAAYGTTPAGKAEGSSQGATLACFSATITLATQTTSDTIVLAKVPEGYRFSHGIMTTGTSLGSATVAIGVAGTTGKYRAAATFTATNTPTMFGVATGVNAAVASGGETVFVTIGTASLPGSGDLRINLYYYKA